MPSSSFSHLSQARRNHLFHRLFQTVLLALFIFRVSATSSEEEVPTTTSIAEPSQTLSNLFSEVHPILSGVTTGLTEATTTIVDHHGAQLHLKVSSSGGKTPDDSTVLDKTARPEISEPANPDDTIEVDEDKCPEGYDEVLREERVVEEGEEGGEVASNGTGTASVAEAIIEKNAKNHPPVINDAPIDPLDQSFIETVQEVAGSSTSEDKEDLEDFLAELFQESEGTSSDNTAESPVEPKPTPLTPEEIAEQKRLLEIETREKRIEITGRHTQWEARLEERAKEVLDELLKQVKEFRAQVSKDVRTNGDIKKLFSVFESEAKKAIQGVELFFEKRIKTEKEIEKRVVKTWEDVLRKVEKKINDKKREVEQEMQEYYNSYLEGELEYVEAAIKRIEKFADDAQADLGMDYAWLEDVTVSDWTRYHDLMKTAKRWGDIYRTVFNSTHPELSSNEVVIALEGPQADLRDISLGIDHVLGGWQEKAEGIFKRDDSVEEKSSLGEERIASQGEAVGEDHAAPVAHHNEL